MPSNPAHHPSSLVTKDTLPDLLRPFRVSDATAAAVGDAPIQVFAVPAEELARVGQEVAPELLAVFPALMQVWSLIGSGFFQGRLLRADGSVADGAMVTENSCEQARLLSPTEVLALLQNEGDFPFEPDDPELVPFFDVGDGLVLCLRQDGAVVPDTNARRVLAADIWDFLVHQVTAGPGWWHGKNT